jgi:hypothetical protein
MLVGVVFAMGIVSACTPIGGEKAMSEQEAKDALVTLIQDSAALIEVEWTEATTPYTNVCEVDGREGEKYVYAYQAPQPDGDPLVDVQKVADYWESKGIDVRVDVDNGPVAYGGGGPIQNVSFRNAAGSYYISGTGVCFPVGSNEG